MSKKIAGIDIGSNAMRLIINEIVESGNNQNEFVKLNYLRLPIRLGGSVFTKGYIDEPKEKEFLKGLLIYKEILEYFQVDKYRACATSAMRSASNSQEILQKIKDFCGLNIEIIDGFEEAEILFYINKHKLKENEYYLSADLGGGSIQLSIFYNEKILWTKSYPIGTVRMLNNSVDKLTLNQYKQEIENLSQKYPKIKLIGTGGNINKISSLVNQKNVEKKQIQKIYNELKPLSVIQRMKKYDLREDRADVIVYACQIYLELMSTFKSDSIYVPKAGLADGIIHKLYEQETNH